MQNIRNFSIIAHIDHGKSTLADRMLEVTDTIEKRKMQDQVLDRMELERERGITIKMQPVRMIWNTNHSDTNHESHSTNQKNSEYILNLIDTPGHIDFSYEVSRALKAVEGVILLVDATQGVQAQTLTTLDMARKQGLTIIPVLSKIDSPLARPQEIKEEVIKVLECSEEDILSCSGKTGEGVPELLDEIVARIPAPEQPEESNDPQALIFDFQYSNHRGVIVYARVFTGVLKARDNFTFAASRKSFGANEVGIFTPDEEPKSELRAGEIGYIVTGIKEPGVASVGDTLIKTNSQTVPLAGYQKPRPVIWASVFPESQDDFTVLRQALERLQLSDSSLSFEEESSGILGRGFRCGFLGMLHLEIITERLTREFDLELVVTTPSITYEVTTKKGDVKNVYSASLFPNYGEIASVKEPWVEVKLLTPSDYINNLMQMFYEFEAIVMDTEVFGDGRTQFTINMPLRALMRNFFDAVKRASSGYASLSYEMLETEPADVVKLEVLVAEEVVPAFSRIIGRGRVEQEAKSMVERLYDLLPRQQFKTKIQAQAQGRIISSKTLSALKKDVTGHLYGGDITRKMKLREKQKKGKKRAQARAKANIPQEVFLKMMRSDS